MVGYSRATSSNESPLIIDNASCSHSREQSTESERLRRRKKEKRRKQRRARCCIGLRDPTSWGVFAAAVALYFVNLIISFLVLLDYVGKLINFTNKRFTAFRIIHRSGIFPDYAPRMKIVEPDPVNLWWDFALADGRIDPFHVFHWLVVELAILMVLLHVFYYEVREFVYGRRQFWLERLAVQIIRMICCAVFGLVSFGPISYCANVPSGIRKNDNLEGGEVRNEAQEAFNMCDFVETRAEAQRRYDYRMEVNDARKARQEYFDGQKVGETKCVKIVISDVFEPCGCEILTKYSDVGHFSDKILILIKVQDYFWRESINIEAIGILGVVMIIVHAGLAIYWKNKLPEDSKRSPWYGFWFSDNYGNVFGGGGGSSDSSDSDDGDRQQRKNQNQSLWQSWFGGGAGSNHDNDSNSDGSSDEARRGERRRRPGRHRKKDRRRQSLESTTSSDDDNVRFQPPPPPQQTSTVFGGLANLFGAEQGGGQEIVAHSSESEEEILMDSGDSSSGAYHPHGGYHHHHEVPPSVNAAAFRRETTSETAIFDADQSHVGFGFPQSHQQQQQQPPGIFGIEKTSSMESW